MHLCKADWPSQCQECRGTCATTGWCQDQRLGFFENQWRRVLQRVSSSFAAGAAADETSARKRAYSIASHSDEGLRRDTDSEGDTAARADQDVAVELNPEKLHMSPSFPRTQQSDADKLGPRDATRKAKSHHPHVMSSSRSASASALRHHKTAGAVGSSGMAG
eukprot:2398132-Amphidinium_carterae.1